MPGPIRPGWVQLPGARVFAIGFFLSSRRFMQIALADDRGRDRIMHVTSPLPRRARLLRLTRRVLIAVFLVVFVECAWFNLPYVLSIGAGSLRSRSWWCLSHRRGYTASVERTGSPIVRDRSRHAPRGAYVRS